MTAPESTARSEMEIVRAEHIRSVGETPLVTAGPATGFFRGTAGSARGVWRYRELLGQLVRKELKTRYKDSVLGFLWSLLRPLSLLLVYYFAIGKFLGAERSIPNFAIYVYSGLTAWSFFSEIVAVGTGSIVANGGLIKKIFLPREVFPLSVLGSALFNFMVQLVIVYAATVIAGEPPPLRQFIWIIAGTSILLVWGTAWAFLLSAVNVYLRDVQYLVEIALLVGFWSCPVVYSWKQVSGELSGPGLENLYLANPIATAVLCFQRGLWMAGVNSPDHPAPPHLLRWAAVAFAVGAVLLWVFQRAFSRLQANFAQEL